MGTETKVGGIYFIDPETRETICLGHIETPQGFSEDVVMIPSAWEVQPAEPSPTISCTVSAGLVNEMSLCWPDGALELTYYTYSQRRRHRKKRINKKWAKKYGFDTHEHTFSGTLQQTII